MKYSRRDVALIALVLALLLALAAGVRFYGLNGQSLWSDEGNSAALAAQPFSQIAGNAAHDIHPPLYYWLLWLWARAGGISEVGLRSLSAVLGVLLVWAIAQLGRTLYDEGTGLAAAFVAALAPFQVYYSQEARMYMLLALLSTLAVLGFWRYVQREDAELRSAAAQPGAVRRIAPVPIYGLPLAVLWAAGLYTHYAYPLMVGVLTLVYLAWVWLRREQAVWRLLRWGLLLGLAVLAYLPWLPIALRQLTTWPSAGSAMNLAGALRTSLDLLAVGPAGPGQSAEWAVGGVVALALMGSVPWRWIRSRTATPGEIAERPAAGPGLLMALTPLIWVLAPLAMMLAFGLFRDAYLKFLLVASPAFVLLVARGIVTPVELTALWVPAGHPSGERQMRLSVEGVLGVIVVIALLGFNGALSSITLVRYFTDPAAARDDYRGIVQFVAATSQPGDAILLDAPGQGQVFGYYYRGTLPIYALPRQRPIDGPATLQELEKLTGHKKIYAVYWATQEADPGRLIENWMNARGYKTLDQWRGNVRLAVYVMPESRPPDESAQDLGLQLGPDIVLDGYRGWNLSPTAGEVTQLQLVWRANQAPTRRYKAFLQLLDAKDQVIAQRDAEPAGDGRATNTWKPGEVVLDNHGLLIPPGTPPGSYRRIVGLYDVDSMQRLRLQTGEDFVSLPPVTVKRTAAPPPLAALEMQHSQRFDFGGVSLLGYDRYKRGFRHAPQTPLYPGDRLHVTFYWQANIRPRADWWFEMTLSDASGHQVAAVQAPLVGDSYGTTLWQMNELVRGEHDLALPSDLAPDTYRLSLVLLPDTNTSAGSAYLGTVRVERPKR